MPWLRWARWRRSRSSRSCISTATNTGRRLRRRWRVGPRLRGKKPSGLGPMIEIESVTEIAPPAPAERAAADGARQSAVSVYECIVNGQRVLSDQPCGPDARARSVVIDQPDPQEVLRQQQRTWAVQAGSTPAAPVPAPQSSRRLGGAEAMAANEQACRWVDEAIANLNARMRQGYTSQEGERLRSDWHDLQKQRADYDCGRQR